MPEPRDVHGNRPVRPATAFPACLRVAQRSRLALPSPDARDVRPWLLFLRGVALRLRCPTEAQPYHGLVGASGRRATVHVRIRPPAVGDPPARWDMVEDRRTHRADPSIAVLASGAAWIDQGRCDHAGYARSDDQRLRVQHQARAGPAGHREEDRESGPRTSKATSPSGHMGGAARTPSIGPSATPKKTQLAFGTGEHAGMWRMGSPRRTGSPRREPGWPVRIRVHPCRTSGRRGVHRRSRSPSSVR